MTNERLAVLTELFLDASAGHALKQDGLATVSSHNAQFVETLRAYAKDYCKRFGSITTDDLRLYATAHGLYPTHHNAWGCIFKQKGWTVIGRQPSKLPGNHNREIRVWKWEGV